MSDIKGTFIYHDVDLLPKPTRSTSFKTVARVAAVLALVLLSSTALHRSIVVQDTGRHNAHLSGGDSSEFPPSHIPQTVHYQLNLSQAWMNPGKNRGNLA